MWTLSCKWHSAEKLLSSKRSAKKTPGYNSVLFSWWKITFRSQPEDKGIVQPQDIFNGPTSIFKLLCYNKCNKFAQAALMSYYEDPESTLLYQFAVTLTFQNIFAQLCSRSYTPSPQCPWQIFRPTACQRNLENMDDSDICLDCRQWKTKAVVVNPLGLLSQLWKVVWINCSF